MLTTGLNNNSELAREKMWSRIHLIPLLQAEEDRDLVRRHLADQAREKELLGENMKVYNSDKHVFFFYFVRQISLLSMCSKQEQEQEQESALMGYIQLADT